MVGELYGVVSRLGGEAFTLAANAARTAGANGAAVAGFGRFRRLIMLLSITASATDAGDTLDVYVDGSLDGSSTWFNVAHFPQQAGNGAAVMHVAVLDPSDPGTATFNVTSDAAAGAVRPAVYAPYLRARWAVVDSGDGNSSHTFSVVGWGQ